MQMIKIKRWFTLGELLIYVVITTLMLWITISLYIVWKEKIDTHIKIQNVISNINLNYNKRTNLYIKEINHPGMIYIDKEMKDTFLCEDELCMDSKINQKINSIYPTESYTVKSVILSKNVYKDNLIYNYAIWVNLPQRNGKNDAYNQIVFIQEVREILNPSNLIQESHVVREWDLEIYSKITSWLYKIKVTINKDDFFLYLVTNIQDKNNFY